jgi:hypothetical protein
LKNHLLLSVLLIGALISGCAPQAQPISPPPYPPPVTPTTAVSLGSVTGSILLQGRVNHEGVTVSIAELPPVTTNSDGTYSIVNSVPRGQHVIKAEKPGYLGATGYVEIGEESATQTMPPVTLLAGDLNADDVINLFDLVLIGTLLGNQDTESLRSDLNADGAVNLFDLVLVGNNLDKSGPVAFE